MIEPQLNNFASPIFETVCREFIRGKNHKGELSFRISKLGRWWGKLNKAVPTDNGKSKLTSVECEIDIVAVDAKSENYILGECKFRNSKMGTSDFDSLKEKSLIVKKGKAIKYALFSKTGFTKNLTMKAKENENLILLSLLDIING
jgi:predicted helicase